ncbi:MAG: hypothetical protein NZM04_08220 [Methylacidiphilales bacterium]|nr:hypothetical protein [Candidatus Methylacidiphilales bacterium]
MGKIEIQLGKLLLESNGARTVASDDATSAHGAITDTAEATISKKDKDIFTRSILKYQIQPIFLMSKIDVS